MKSGPTRRTSEKGGEGSAVDPVFFAKVQELQKKADISELVELMEASHKNKSWLCAEVKKKRQRVHVTPDMGLVAILRHCDTEFIIGLTNALRNKKLRQYDLPNPMSKTYHWFFTDIVSGSDPTIPTSEQARKIYVLNSIIAESETFKQRIPENTLILPTGDGMAIGFADSPETPLKLSLEVHEGLYAYNKSIRSAKNRLSIRIGLDTGPVFPVQDLNGNENVWGPGIIMARRVMDLAREMNILASSRFANDIRNLKPEYEQIVHPIGDYQIKHDEKILIYNIYGDGFGNRNAPLQERSTKSQEPNTEFVFKSIQIDLQIIDSDTMLTHHKVRQSYINVGTTPIELLYFYFDGDIPKEFPDCNASVKDEAGKEMEMISLSENEPRHKAFYIKLRKPIKPGEKARYATLEYDWEEKDRQFGYTFASDCRHFDIRISIPKGLEISQKVVRIFKESGKKVLAPDPATVKYLSDKTEISWGGDNFHQYESYRFDW